jgi:hypothetical protein
VALRLCAATPYGWVVAYRASLEPQGVDPSTVAPGTRFRTGDTLNPVGVVMCWGPEALRVYRIDGADEVWDFDKDTRIIPISQEK